MNRPVFISVTFTVCILMYAFTYKSNNNIKARDVEQDLIQVSGSLFMSKYEVSNKDYKRFMTYLAESNQNDLFKQCLWDSTKWSFYFGNEPLKAYYHSHNSYENYPVVNISYEAANEYCKWMTSQYNSNSNRKFTNVVFRLPSEQEWKVAATGGNKNKMYPWDTYYLRNKKGEYLCNFLSIGDQAITYDKVEKSYKVVENMAIRSRAILPTQINSFLPSPSGFYNLSGNAAEMVSEKGLAKGGSFNDPGNDVTTASKKYYDAASPEVGFRIAMEIVEK